MLAEHDVYLSASRSDGASISLMEAMAGGCFPVVSDIEANREWLEDGKNALTFPCGDDEKLAGIILSLPPRRDFIQSAVARNRAVAEERADREKNLALLLERMEKVVSSR
jgi:glycosyltransferase involved in cell wall biosynthesis